MEKSDYSVREGFDRAAPVLYSECLTSTNSVLKRLAAAGAASGTVLWAREQTAGRGRLGRSFLSPEGGIYLSVLWRPGCPPEKTVSLTACAAAALCRWIEGYGLKPEIKWPNDVLLDGKKLSGILTEGFTAPDGGFSVVLGIGVNVNTESFPEELADTAVSLRMATGRIWELDGLARELIAQLDGMYRLWCAGPGAFLKEYHSRCTTTGHEVLLESGGLSIPARAVGINDDYSLAVETAGGERRDVRFGEVSVRMQH